MEMSQNTILGSLESQIKTNLIGLLARSDCLFFAFLSLNLKPLLFGLIDHIIIIERVILFDPSVFVLLLYPSK